MKKHRIWIAVIAILTAIGVACGFYAGDYYRAQDVSLESREAYCVVQEKNSIAFVPEVPELGLIFYPGGKVEHTAYAPLMEKLAEKGVLCVLMQMPLRLAVLDMNAADGVQERYPQVTCWYMGGHSLGGAMAASYVAKHPSDFAGLLLLGAYSTADLSDSGLTVISVYGSEDGVLNREKYEKYRHNLPADFTEWVIPGGCHAYFGSYGAQKGDGIPTVSPTQQIQKTADIFLQTAK